MRKGKGVENEGNVSQNAPHSARHKVGAQKIMYLMMGPMNAKAGPATAAYLTPLHPFLVVSEFNEIAFGRSYGPFVDDLGATGLCCQLHISGHKGKYLSLLKSYGKLLNGPKEEPAACCSLVSPHTPDVGSRRVKTGQIKSVRLITPKKQELAM